MSFPLDIIKYSTFRESCQSSDCTKIEREICATCILTKTRSAPSVRGPPRRICENCTKKTRWISPPSFYCLVEQGAEQGVNVDFRLVLFLAALCDFNGVGLEIVKHIHRHLVFPSAGHWTSVASIAASAVLASRSFYIISWAFSRSSHSILFFSVIITKYLFPCFFLFPWNNFIVS